MLNVTIAIRNARIKKIMAEVATGRFKLSKTGRRITMHCLHAFQQGRGCQRRADGLLYIVYMLSRKVEVFKDRQTDYFALATCFTER